MVPPLLYAKLAFRNNLRCESRQCLLVIGADNDASVAGVGRINSVSKALEIAMHLEYLFEFSVEFKTVISVREGPLGERIIADLNGGSFEGLKL